MYKKSITSGYVCLICRKFYKKYTFSQDKRGKWMPLEYQVKCPQCSESMYKTGSAFKAPSSGNNKQWDKLIPLFRKGYKFYPDRGNPFDEVILSKPNKTTSTASEFRKPARKRNK